MIVCFLFSYGRYARNWFHLKTAAFTPRPSSISGRPHDKEDATDAHPKCRRGDEERKIEFHAARLSGRVTRSMNYISRGIVGDLFPGRLDHYFKTSAFALIHQACLRSIRRSGFQRLHVHVHGSDQSNNQQKAEENAQNARQIPDKHASPLGLICDVLRHHRG
jgi:hypothetical protein